MRFWPFDNSVKLERQQEDYDRWKFSQELRQFAEDADFDLEDEGAHERAAKALEHYRKGGTFVIKKEYRGPAGSNYTKVIASVDRFPTYDDVVDRVESEYGGGFYMICPNGTSRRIYRTYKVEGESKIQNPNAKRGSSSVKGNIDAVLSERISDLIESNPELADQLTLSVLEKHLKIKLTGAGNWEDEEVQREIQSNPSYREQWLQGKLKKAGIRTRGEPSQIDELVAFVKQLDKVQGVIGGKEDNSWRGMAKDVIKGLGESGALGQLMQGKPQEQSGTIEHRPQYQPLPPPSRPATQQVPPYAPPIEPPIRAPQPVQREVIPEQTHPVSGQVPTQPVDYQEEIMEQPEQLTLKTDVNWIALLMEMDWSEVERYVHAGPGEFMQWCYTEMYESDSEGHEVLVSLFLDNEPGMIAGAFQRAEEIMDEWWGKTWVQTAAASLNKTEDYGRAKNLLRWLYGDLDGHKWIVAAHEGAKIIQGRVDELSAREGEMVEGEVEGAVVLDQTPIDVPTIEIPTDELSNPITSNGNHSEEREDILI